MGGTSSWSSSTEQAKIFGDILFIPINSIPLATAIAHLSSQPGEKEVIVSKKVKFKITKIDIRQGEEKGAVHVYVEGK